MEIRKLVKSNMVKYKKDLVILILLNVVYLITSIIIPYMTGKFIDILNHKDKKLMIFFIKVFLIISAIEIVTKYFKEIFTIKYKLEVSSHINFDTVEHVKKVPLRLLNDKNMTYMNSKIAFDSEMTIALIVDYIFSLISEIITFIVSFLIISKINFKISLVMITLIPLYIALYHVLKNPIYKSFMNFKNSQSKFFATINDQLSKIKLIKINSNFDMFAREIKGAIGKLTKNGMKYIKVNSIFSNLGLALNRVLLIFLFVYGGFQIINNKLTLGNFVIINSYFSTLISSLEFFLNFGSLYKNTLVSYDRLEEILVIPEEIIGAEELNELNSITFNNLSFSYNNQKEIFRNFNYKFEKGKIYCILGENGRGKSTLIDLMVGLRDDYNGQIYYDSIELRNLNIYNIRKKLIGFTEQEPLLINASLGKNLTFSDNSLDNECFNTYAEKINLNDFVKHLDNNLNSIIRADSKTISGGEKQKIAILRSIIKNPEILIFDEPTSALDTASIDKFKNLICEMKNDKIIIIITHDNSLLDICDETLNLSTDYKIGNIVV